jgi:hypothetical protein
MLVFAVRRLPGRSKKLCPDVRSASVIKQVALEELPGLGAAAKLLGRILKACLSPGPIPIIGAYVPQTRRRNMPCGMNALKKG